MTRQQSEGEVHVEAMRLILAEMERREDVPDWTIWQHMLNMLETIFQGIEDQRDDDRDELMHTRKDRDHWRQARQDAHEAGELMRAEIETLRKELADAKRAASDEFVERQVLTVEQQQDAAAWQQQVDSANAEVSYLRARLDEERSVSAGLRQQLRTAAGRVDLTEETNRSLREQLDAAQAAVTLQRAGIERLQAFVAKARQRVTPMITISDVKFLHAALAELDAGTETSPATEPTPCPEVERLRAFVEIMRGLLTAEYADQRIIAAAIAKLDDAGNSSVTLTSSPAPVAEPLDVEGDTCPGK